MPVMKTMKVMKAMKATAKPKAAEEPAMDGKPMVIAHKILIINKKAVKCSVCGRQTLLKSRQRFEREAMGCAGKKENCQQARIRSRLFQERLRETKKAATRPKATMAAALSDNTMEVEVVMKVKVRIGPDTPIYDIVDQALDAAILNSGTCSAGPALPVRDGPAHPVVWDTCINDSYPQRIVVDWAQ